MNLSSVFEWSSPIDCRCNIYVTGTNMTDDGTLQLPAGYNENKLITIRTTNTSADFTADLYVINIIKYSDKICC